MLYEKYGKPLTGVVKRIDDGDTFLIYMHQYGMERKVRLYGIDAPELNQPHGQTAKQYLSSIVAKKVVKIIPVEIDKYDRLASFVFYEDLSINEHMVATGNAVIYPDYCDQEFFEYLTPVQSDAANNKRGIWSLPSFKYPESHRKEQVYADNKEYFKGINRPDQNKPSQRVKVWTTADFNVPLTSEHKPINTPLEYAKQFPESKFSLWGGYMMSNHSTLLTVLFIPAAIIAVFLFYALLGIISKIF